MKKAVRQAIGHIFDFENHMTFETALRAAAVDGDFQVVVLSKNCNPVFNVETRHRITLGNAIKKARSEGIEAFLSEQFERIADAENASFHGSAEETGSRIETEAHERKFKEITAEGVRTFWGAISIGGEAKILLIADNEGSYSAADVSDLAEIIELGMKRWHFEPHPDIVTEMIRALRRNKLEEALRLEEKTELRLDDISYVFVEENKNNGEKTISKDNPEEIFGKNAKIYTEIGERERYGIVFDARGEEGKPCRAKEAEKGNAPMYICKAEDAKQACAGFRLIGSVKESTGRVFPCRRLFAKSELLLAVQCLSISKDDEVRRHFEEILLPVKRLSLVKAEQLISTLGVYMLDAAGDARLASKLLDVHYNTIQYRLGKAEKLLGEDFADAVFMSDLRLSLALDRCLNNDKT